VPVDLDPQGQGAHARGARLAVLYFIPAINLGGLPPFSGFIGKFALFDAAAEVGTPLMYVLIVGGIVTSLLTLYTLMRAWNLAFWREDDDHGGDRRRRAHLVPRRRPAADDRAPPRHSAHHDRDDRGDGRGHRRAHGLRRSAVRALREHRRDAAHARDPRAARRRRDHEPDEGGRGIVWRQLPFFVWLIALWMLLWGSSRCSPPDGRRRGARRHPRLPAAAVELSGRVNLWYGSSSW
jgi:hypothetical protein